MDSQIAGIYGNRVRLRVCGICWRGEELLMVRHRGLGNGMFWSPPGGGVDFGESLENALTREFLEETGLAIHSLKFKFGCEVIAPPLHAVELFYDVESTGTPITGNDPEIQIIEDVQFIDLETLQNVDPGTLHGIFRIAKTKADFERLNGFYKL